MKKFFILALLLCTSAFIAFGSSWDSYKQQTLHVQKTIPGWCSTEKAQKLMDLVYEVHPKICVEIGVFGGSSVYPTARALKFLKEGVIYAIDPWSNIECTQGYTSDDPNYGWWNQIDLEKVYCDFKSLIESHGLSPYCNIMRMTSKEALLTFADESIDILHIDGNHTEEVAFADAQMFLPKLKKGGYLWFDDVDWSTTKKAVVYISEHCELLADRSVGNSCLLFRKL